MIEGLRLTNFKAFEDFSLRLDGDALLVGPNNAGKSTLISAIRVCARMIDRAKQVNADLTRDDRGQEVSAYSLHSDQLELIEENLRHEFHNVTTRLELRFSGGMALYAVWPELHDRSYPAEGDIHDEEEEEEEEEEDFAYWGDDLEHEEAEQPFFYFLGDNGAQPARPSDARRLLPQIGVVPSLKPLNQQEQVLSEPYVRQNLDTHLASAHFRNQLVLLGPPNFHSWRARLYEKFVEFAEPWLPEIAISMIRTRAVPGAITELDVFYTEPDRRAEKEIFWAGDGIQVWLQILYHVFRLRDASTVVLDEPDLYLHADLQRRLARLLEAVEFQSITTTHSLEMLLEAPPESIVWIDKSRRRAVRGPAAKVLADISAAVGSHFNLRLAKALRSRVVLFVEGDDMKILRLLAETLGASQLAAEMGIAVVPLRGFSNWDRIEPFAWLVRELLQEAVEVFVLLDRDYRSEDEIAEVSSRLGALGVTAHVWRRKELESYLVNFDALARLTGAPSEYVHDSLVASANSMHHAVFARAHYAQQRCSVDAAHHAVSVTESFQLAFDEEWEDEERRLQLCPPKDLLTDLNRDLQADGYRPTTARALGSTLTEKEIPEELADELLRVERALSGVSDAT